MRTPSPRRLIAAAAMLLSVATVTAAAQRAFADVSGKWLFSVTTPDRTQESIMMLKQEGDALTGVVEIEQMGTRNLAGSVKGDTVRFAFSIDLQGTLLDLRGAGLIQDKDNFTGQIELPNGMGMFPFTAKRQP